MREGFGFCPMAGHNPFILNTPFQTQRYSGPAAAFLESLDEDTTGLVKGLFLSVLAHVGLIAAIALIMFLLQLLGWVHLPAFERPKLNKDIEFQLVTTPEAKPRDPNTKNRAERNSRAGGQKTPNMRQAETIRQAGTPSKKRQPTPTPAKRQASTQKTQPAAKPQPNRAPKMASRPQPPKLEKNPTQSTPSKLPAPPKPRLTAPKAAPTRSSLRSVPNPVSPVQTSSTEVASATGPVVRRNGAAGSPSGVSNSSSSGASPATLPGQFSSGGRSGGASGGTAGQGGRGAYSQVGSAGGGGGRPGVDAIAEPDFGAYLADLQRRIRRNWHPPDDKEDKTIVMVFTIAKDGRLLSVNTRRSSGIPEADSAAQMAVEASAPFRPLPAGYRNPSINVEFTFDYNVYRGGGGGIRRR